MFTKEPWVPQGLSCGVLYNAQKISSMSKLPALFSAGYTVKVTKNVDVKAN